MQGVISYSSFCVDIIHRVRNKVFWAILKVAPKCVVIKYKLKVSGNTLMLLLNKVDYGTTVAAKRLIEI